MLKEEKVFIVNILLISLAFVIGLFAQTHFKLLPQEPKVIVTEKVVVQKEYEVKVIEQPAPACPVFQQPVCPEPPKKKGFFN